MEHKDMINNLEKFDTESLNDILKKIETIKKQRQESKFENIKNKLNNLLEQINEILEELQKDDLLGDCDYLIGNEFVVLDYDDRKYIDLRY